MRSDLNLALQIVAVGVCVLLRLTTPGWLLVIFFIFVPVATVALVTQIVLAAAAVRAATAHDERLAGVRAVGGERARRGGGDPRRRRLGAQHQQPARPAARPRPPRPDADRAAPAPDLGRRPGLGDRRPGDLAQEHTAGAGALPVLVGPGACRARLERRGPGARPPTPPGSRCGGPPGRRCRARSRRAGRRCAPAPSRAASSQLVLAQFVAHGRHPAVARAYAAGVRRTVGGRRMTRTVADRMVESAGRGWVGREREIDALLAAATADEPPFLVAFVHGPGGIGKSHLVRRLLDGLPAPVRGVYLDGRDVEPTPRGLRRALGQALGLAAADPDVGALARALAARPTVLVIDTYEALGLLDAWLRTQFLPALPATTLTVLAGRDRPATAWHTTAGWQGLVAEFPLAALSADEADQLLRRRGLDERQARWAGEFAHGHPLALELAAAAVRADPRCTRRPSGGARRPAGSVPRAAPARDRHPRRGRVDRPPDHRARPRRHARDAVGPRRLRRPARAAVHGADRRRAAAARRGPRHRRQRPGDARPRPAPRLPPPRRRAPHRAPARYDRGPVAAHGRPHVPHREPRAARRVLPQRPACATGSSPPRRATGPPSSTSSRGTSRRPPLLCSPLVGAPRRDVLGGPRRRRRGGGVRPDRRARPARASLPADDPVADAWRAHLRDHPPAADDRVLVMRRWLGRQSGELRSPAVSACWLDVKRVYMQLRPRLRRIYSVVVDLPRLAPIFGPLGFAPAGEPVLVDGTAQQPVWLDFGPGSVDGWLAGLIGAETTTRSRTWRRTGRFGDRPVQPRARGAPPRRRRPQQPRDRRAAVHQREDRGQARVEHLHQARRPQPGRGRAHRGRARASPSCRPCPATTAIGSADRRDRPMRRACPST